MHGSELEPDSFYSYFIAKYSNKISNANPSNYPDLHQFAVLAMSRPWSTSQPAWITRQCQWQDPFSPAQITGRKLMSADGISNSWQLKSHRRSGLPTAVASGSYKDCVFDFLHAAVILVSVKWKTHLKTAVAVQQQQ